MHYCFNGACSYHFTAANAIEFRGLLTVLPKEYTATLEGQKIFKFNFYKAGPGPIPPVPSGQILYSIFLMTKVIIDNIVNIHFFR